MIFPFCLPLRCLFRGHAWLWSHNRKPPYQAVWRCQHCPATLPIRLEGTR